MQTNSSRTSPTPGASTAAINAEDAAMNKSDALQISLAHMLSRPSTLRIDWDRKKVAFEFDFNDVNGNLEPVNGADRCLQNLYAIPDGASRPTLFVHANRAEAGSGVEGRAQPRPCQIHEVQNACGSAEGSGASCTGSTGNTPRCIRPLPRRNQILNGPASAAPTTSNANPNASETQAGATYDNTNTPPASSDNEGDDDDDDVPLIVFKEKTVAQKRKAAAIFEPMIKVEPTEKEYASAAPAPSSALTLIPPHRSGKRLHPARRQFKIRNLKEHVRWYYTKSIRPIDAVPADLLKPRHESLYVHRFKVPFVGWQIWIYVKCAEASLRVQAAADAGGNNGNRDGNGNGNGGEDGERQYGEWRRVQIGDAHPRLKGYVLHMLDENEPRWVKEKSARDYASGKHKRARWTKSM
ncbi:hypothetical protein LXA43DRAFT_1103362 [Ganoderma leucocontextum]|nr:hypothetical protein LXA43DRAFT_1103362 [Ganoderma leucocontextum]